MKYLFLMASLLTLSSAAICDEMLEKDVTVYGQNIHYAETGDGPPVILLHGLWGGLNEWQPIIDKLARDNRVIAMDFIGFHGSDKPDVQYHNALLSQFLAGFIEALDLSDVTLVGHAMGANTATYTAIHHPGNIRALVLIDGAGYRNPNRDLSQPPSDAMQRFRRVATGSTLSTTRELLERRVSDPALVTEEWVKNAYRLWINSAAAIADMLLEGGDVTEEEMRGIDLPTLIVWGAEDKVFSVDNTTRLGGDISGSEVRIIEGSGHLPQIEKTRAFLKVVVPFLKSTGPDQ